MDKEISSIFKPYLAPKKVYRGGKNPPVGQGKIYKLSSNENPIGTSPLAIEAIKKASEEVYLYPDQTDIRLREALVGDFDQRITADQFICANSGSELIDMVLRAFIEPGDQVIYSNPCFLPYSVFSRWYGAEQTDIRLTDEDYALDVEGVLNAITGRTKIIFLTSPNNPTGGYIPKKILQGFLDQIPKNVLVVFDEVYRHFADADDYVSALEFVEKGYPIIGLNSFSKTYGLAGQRIGYGYTTLEIAHYLRNIHKPFLLPLTSIEAGIAALKDKWFVDKTVDTVLSGKQELMDFFDSNGIKYWPSQANFILIDPPIHETEFIERLMGSGIMVRSATQFGAEGKVRISIGDKEANAALMTSIKELFK